MKSFRPYRRLTLWLVSLAMVFAALAPALSHALALTLASGSDNWIEVCTAQGSRWVAPDEGGQDKPADPKNVVTGHFDHCPCCHLGSLSMAPPPVHAAPAILAVQSEGPPERFFSAPRTQHAWRSAPSRAPPIAS